MDKKDLQILSAISELGTGSPERIQEKTDIPKSTVHYRITKLQEAGVIEDDLYSIDLSSIGLEITLISEVSAEYEEGYHTEVGDELSQIEGVNKVYFMMGDTDFVVISKLADRNMVEELIADFEEIDGVNRTNSQFVITTVKDTTNPIAAYSSEALTSMVSETE
ncbi:Lrp/AsnC family transcriptional regulator [Halomicroarcula limicola]|uniref:Lrp/AsnC family transcriptional regulator n=1 Tax=Haloarcula limicola TaxID=1429915 RepID=A0A8J8CAB5_9EURY|nr:Lrp/AsnC family transcriptional regulator [Halomicroarcula limicola]MBV0926320.1 Lrp/AsnC family transcriptional regulator [Halomicroarcula limicola]